LGLTTDNAASMIVCGNTLKHNLLSDAENKCFNHYRCVAHILNIAAQQGINALSNEITKVRQLMSKIRSSVNLCDDLRALCAMKELEYLNPEIDVVTRWNSTFYMLQKLIRMDSALKLLVIDHNNINELYPNTEEWGNIKVYTFSFI
jgi:hypothetical protein